MDLDKNLKQLDAQRVLSVAEKILSQIPQHEKAFLLVPEEYIALNALIKRANRMSEVVTQRINEGLSETDDEAVSFLRGITAGVWLTTAVLSDYAQADKFEAEFRLEEESS